MLFIRQASEALSKPSSLTRKITDGRPMGKSYVCTSSLIVVNGEYTKLQSTLPPTRQLYLPTCISILQKTVCLSVSQSTASLVQLNSNPTIPQKNQTLSISQHNNPQSSAQLSPQIPIRKSSQVKSSQVKSSQVKSNPPPSQEKP